MAHRPDPAIEPAVDESVSLAPRYRVIIHDDDLTPMDFVVQVLVSVFRLPLGEADQVMLEAHHSGVAHVVTLSLEEAEARVDKAHALARTALYPLTFTYEPE